MGVVLVLFGAVIVGVGLIGNSAAESGNIVKLGGGLLSSGSLVPFKMGWYRFERIAYLNLLRERWDQLAQAGDPGKEIPELKKMFLKVMRDSLGKAA
jgi:hypothetical protein